MAEFTVQTIDRDGVNPVYNAANGGGDEFANTGVEFIIIKNDDVSATTLTIETTQQVDELDIDNRDVSIPAGEERVIGPFPDSVYSDDNGMVQFTYSSVTSLTVAVLKPGS